VYITPVPFPVNSMLSLERDFFFPRRSYSPSGMSSRSILKITGRVPSLQQAIMR
jgi:hypothetical protein